MYLNCCLVAQKASDFHRTIGDAGIKNNLSNFKLHLARVSICLLAGKANPTVVEISAVEVSNLDQAVFDQAKDLLNGAIIDYQAANPGSNLINMAKVKQFTDYLTIKLGSQF